MAELMACCALVAALFGTAFRKISRRGARESPVAAARWSPPESAEQKAAFR